MRFIFSKIFSVLFSKKEVRLGLDNAGKTILLYQMQCDEQSEIRPYWKCYYPKTNAVVFVIDSSDKERIDIAKQELFLTDRNQILYIFLIIKYFSYEQRTLLVLYLSHNFF